MYVLDTNTIIYYFKGRGNIAPNLLAHPPSTIFLPTIVIYELEFGLAMSQAPQKPRQQLQTLLKAINILSFGATEARVTARIRASLEKQGTPIGPHDLLIAGTALAQGAVLVTHNTREFQRVAGLQLEDWF